MTDEWQPITKEELFEIIEEELPCCSQQNRIYFEKIKTDLNSATLIRYGQKETVFIVAKSGNEVIYYEDVEEGFNVSAINGDGEILNHYCNQDSLDLALRKLSKEIIGQNILPAIKI